MRKQKSFSSDKKRRNGRHLAVRTPIRIPLPMALANRFLEDIRFEQLLNEELDWDEGQWNVSPGTLCKAIILSTFERLRAPIYRIGDRYMDMDTEALLGVGVARESLNARELARAMDRLYEKDPERLFRILALTAMTVYKIAFERLHTDTTTISFYGEYEGSEEDGEEPGEGETQHPIVLARGYNKDHRVECKQLVYGKIVTENGIPLAYKAMDGNTSDVEWNKSAIDLADKLFQELKVNQGVMIADAKLMCKEHLDRMCAPDHPVRFISRIPANFASKLEARSIEEAYQAGAWQDVGQYGSKSKAANYWIRQSQVKAHGHTLNIVVCRSSESAERFQQAMDKQKRELQKAIVQTNKKMFACLKDAQLEYSRFQKEHKRSLFVVSARFDEIKEPIRGRGRPAKDGIPKFRSTYNLHLELTGEDAEVVEQQRREKESFVLASNVLEMDGVDVLRNYKNQQVVEIDFRLFKEPCLASVIYLKKPERVEALTMLLSVSLLIRALVQHNMRRSIAAYEGELPRIGHHYSKMTPHPTYMLFHEEMCYSGFVKLGKQNYGIYIRDDSEKALQHEQLYIRFAGYELEELI